MSEVTEQQVRAANEAFYRAFREGDLASLRLLWSTQSLVACMHPGWPALHGHAQVLASFAAIIRSGAPAVHAHESRVTLLSDSAFVTCVEHLDTTRLVATNIFALQQAQWKLVHHQSAPFREESVPSEIAPPGALLN